MKPVIKLYNYLFTLVTRFTSYGIAVALLAAGISGWIAMAFAVYYARAIQLALDESLILTLFGLFAGAIALHGLQFGILRKLGIPGVGTSVRTVNRHILYRKSSGRIEVARDLSVEEYSRLLKAIIRLPMINTLTTTFWAFVIGVTINILYWNKSGTLGLNTEEALRGVIFISITLLIAMFINGMFCYSLGEISTGAVRGRIKQILWEKNIEYRDSATFSVRGKSILLLGLFLVTIYVSNTQTFSLVSTLTQTTTASDKKESQPAAPLSKGTHSFTNLSFAEKLEKLQPVIVFVAVSLAFALLMVQLLFVTIRRSLDEVHLALEDLVGGGEGRLFPQTLDSEFISLAGGVTHAAGKIHEYQSSLEEKVKERTVALEKAVTDLKAKDSIIQMELDVARDIQQGMLPEHFPDWNGIRFSHEFIPMETVSGDFMDVYRLPGNRLGVLIADVSGHGIPAALITTMAKVAFGKAVEQHHSIATMYAQINREICSIVKTQDYLTAFFVIIDEDHNITYGNAAHQRAKILRAAEGRIVELDTGGILLGAMEGEDADGSYREDRDRLLPGDRLFLYTDGIVERKSISGEEFGHGRFDNLLLQAGEMSLRAAREYIMTEFQKFADGTEPDDDISLLMLEVAPHWGKFVSLVSRADEQFEQENYELALENYKEAIRLEKYHEATLMKFANTLVKLRKLGPARKVLLRYLDQNKNNADCYFLMSGVCSRLKDHEEAEYYARTGLELRPSQISGHLALAKALAAQGKLEAAEESLLKGLDNDPENGLLRENLKKVRSGMRRTNQ